MKVWCRDKETTKEEETESRNKQVQFGSKYCKCLSPASEACREVANLTERKNPHTPTYGVKEFVCMSVCNKK